MMVSNHPPSQTAPGRQTVRPLFALGLLSLLLVGQLGSARSQGTADAVPPQFSFRSLPMLRSVNADVPLGSQMPLFSLPPSVFALPRELLWQGPGTDTPTASQAALADATQAVTEATRRSLAALKAGDTVGYVAVLAPDYVQSGLRGETQNKADVLRAAQADLVGHSYTGAGFEITGLHLVTPTEAAVTMTQRVVTVTKNTPPTVYPMGNGQSYIQSNTVTVHRTTVFHQTWVKRGAEWFLVRSQAVDIVATAVA